MCPFWFVSAARFNEEKRDKKRSGKNNKKINKNEDRNGIASIPLSYGHRPSTGKSPMFIWT
jgi:hypothetical protein